MRKLLLLLVCALISMGTRAADISGVVDGVTGNTGYNPKSQLIKVTRPGALAEWVAAVTGDNYDTNNPFHGLGGSDDFDVLEIEGELNANDLAALNSATCAAFSRFPKVDMSRVTLASDATAADVCGVNFGAASFVKNSTTISGTGAQYILLPNGQTSPDDVTAMNKMKSGGKNNNLKVVGSFDGSNSTLPELALYSFAENELSNFSSQMMNLADRAMVARLAGTFGDQDLVSSNNVPVFGWTPPCIWDFTGATFTSCTADPGVSREYYAYDDPFCEGTTSKPSSNHQTNAFIKFSNYSTTVVDIKLPTGITELPPHCLNDLGSQNIKKPLHKAAYKAYYNVTDADLESDLYKVIGQTDAAIIPDLIIPNNYVKLDYECGSAAHIKHLVIGSGVKIVEGGAFYDCLDLEDLDFASGLSNCYLGDRAFHGEENSLMKHIALSEGIVSLGYQCFQNAQHLESIRLPQSLLYIGNHSFNNCLALNSITIPENVRQIGQGAFILCPFTDIYLTTTDPSRIPLIWSCGTNFLAFDGNCSFHHAHIDGWEGGVDAYKDQINGKMTWDEAAEFYFTHWNGMPVLHFPKQLAEKVRSSISSLYAMKSADDPAYGLPLRVDMDKRDDIPGADLGSSGAGKYTQDGWAQFMLMKDYSLDPGNEVYQKEFEDVWYTICYPFDLTDEQLAAAFNETFNIVDFSGVEVMAADDPNNTTGMQTLTLHFNTVAKTYYRDNEGNEYEVIGREKDPTSGFNYNIYRRDGVEYHHSQVSDFLSSNKTKTFAPGNSITQANANKDNAIFIDGYLATAGHPYMVHPAIGTSLGNPRKCTFAGIEWKPQTQWPTIYEAQKRVVDLGESKGTPETNTPDADNYLQAAYGDYAGQTYTFIGNSAQYSDEAAAAIGNEPELPGIEPVERTQPTAEEVEALKPEGEPLEAPTPVVQDPDQNTEKYSEDFKELFKTVRCSYTGWNAEAQDQNFLYEFTYGEDLGNYTSDEFLEFRQWHNNKEVNAYFYKTQAAQHNSSTVQNISALKAILGEEPVASLDGFNALKQLVSDYKADKEAHASYKVLWDAYIENRAAWAIYNRMNEERQNWNQQTVHDEWVAEHNAWQAKKDAHDAWMEQAKSYQKLIPTGAYFLGRKGTAYPKFYREIADDERPVSERTGGFWTQYTAVIVPNDAAISGIEAELGAGTTATDAKNVNMVFDEGFMGFYDPTEIKQIVAEAEEKGQEVKYVDIVVSINGQVVRRGSTSLEGLPTGLYIVNGKKYYVK